MKKIKLTALAFLCLGAITTSNATYQVIYGDKQIGGDNIKFVSKWLLSDALVSEWVNDGSPSGCSAWTPAESTVDENVTFEQSATGCSQNQTRTVQEREQNNVSSDYRPVGPVKNENRTLSNQTITRSAVGTKSKEECDVPNSTWVAGTPSYSLLNITFNNVLVYSGGDYASTQKVVGTYKYTKGVITANYGSYTISKVCRTAL